MAHQFELPPELEAELEREATERRMSLSELIQEKLRLSPLTEPGHVAEGAGEYLRSLSEKFRSHIPEEERRRMPPDFAKNYRHDRNAFRKEAE